MRLLFAGTPDVAVPSLRALLDSRHDVVAVLTRPDAPTGRGRRLAPSPVAEVALGEGIEVLRPSRPRDPDFLERLAELAPDAAPIVAYGGLIPPAALAVPRHGWINLHFSLLPAWRGAAPVQRAIIAGDEITGACTFQLEEGLDTGPVYGVLTEAIGARDTAGDLLARLARSGAGLLAATLDGIEDATLRPVPQAADGVSQAPKLTVADAHVPWDAPAMHVDRLVRGCTPAPGAWTTFRDERVKLGPVQAAVDSERLAPGEVVVHKSRVLVGTGTSPVLLGEVRAVGRKPMPAPDWARGLRIEPGERLG
jgi:methionyl-tRNA formyltransferase